MFLLYGTAGAVVAHASAHDTHIGNIGGSGYDEGEGTGLFYGGIASLGAALDIGSGVSIFTEASYYKLAEGRITFDPAPLTGHSTTSGASIEVGINKRF